MTRMITAPSITSRILSLHTADLSPDDIAERLRRDTVPANVSTDAVRFTVSKCHDGT